ncbi:hypothetical protein V6N13_090265 [Hibiscus sabdariffa]|uniref:Uncharacterized protein n=1 Tax=Hibiscus sabdariffa TaxID=183260 RepID=A0ABR2C0X2_9ROSI
MESSSPDLMPETPRPTSNPTPNPIKNSNPDTHCSSDQDDDPPEGAANIGAEKKIMSVDPAALRRNSSVSSAYALQLQAAVKTAFSMRRSCSVSESYSRIHDHHPTLTSPLDEDHEVLGITGNRRSVKEKKKKNNTGDKILKAWKKIFRL